jgi:general secretion pathway protein F
MEAPDARAVVERLQRDAYFPIKIAVQEHQRRLLGLAWPDLGGRRVAGRDLASLTQQLATLLEAGLPLDRALAIQAELAPTARLRSIMADVLRTVRGGSSLADALAKHHPRPFSRLYINMVRAGEKGGVLETTLRRLAEFLAESQEFRDALVSALIYPAMLTGVGAAAVVFLMTFVIPRFAAIFKDLGATIPLPTLILLEVSGGLQRYWWVLAGVALAGVLAARIVLASPRGRLTSDRLLLRLPIAGEVIVKTEVARFTRILGTLLRSGIGMIPALTVVKEMLSNQVVAGAVDRLVDGVRRGAGLARPMADSGAFPAIAIHMVRVGEETGRLEEMLLRVATDLEVDTRKLVKRLISLAEPCIILVMGVVVGFIVVAMLMAILSVTDIPL